MILTLFSQSHTLFIIRHIPLQNLVKSFRMIGLNKMNKLMQNNILNKFYRVMNQSFIQRDLLLCGFAVSPL